MWFADGDKQHQRGYPLVDPNPEADTVDIEFALHDGVASRWAQTRGLATPSRRLCWQQFHAARPASKGYVIVGDTASLPAINSLLTASSRQGVPEAGHDDDKQLPVARSANVVWVDRKNAGEALVQAVSESVFDASDHFGWVACDNRTTRAVAKVFREEYSIPRKSIKAQAYWVA